MCVCASVKPGRTVVFPRSIRRSIGERSGLRKGTDADNLASVDHDVPRSVSFAAADIEQFAGVNHDSACTLRLLRSYRCRKNSESAIAGKSSGAFFIRSSLNFGFFRSFRLRQNFATYPGLAPGALFLPLCGFGSRARSSGSFLGGLAASVEAPLLACIGHEEDYEQKQHRQMVEFSAEVVPH